MPALGYGICHPSRMARQPSCLRQFKPKKLWAWERFGLLIIEHGFQDLPGVPGNATRPVATLGMSSNRFQKNLRPLITFLDNRTGLEFDHRLPPQ